MISAGIASASVGDAMQAGLAGRRRAGDDEERRARRAVAAAGSPLAMIGRCGPRARRIG